MTAPLRTAQPPAFQRLLLLSSLVLSVVAAVWLTYQLHRLLLVPMTNEAQGAIDILHRYQELHSWFFGNDGRYLGPIYPPATMVMLYPVIGAISVHVGRYVWALLSLLALVGLTRHAVRLSRPQSRSAAWLAALVVLAHYATGAGLGNAQLTIVVLWALCTAYSMYAPGPPSWGRDAAIAGLLVIALLKPSLSGPLVCALPLLGAWRAGWIGAGLYGLLTMLGYAAKSSQSPHGTDTIGAHVTMKAVEYTGLPPLALYTLSFALLALSWLWLWLHRRQDRWRLFALLAMTTHLQMGRYWYDDLLMVFPLLVLLRELNTRAWGRHTLLAASLGGLLLLFSVAPGGHYVLPPQAAYVYLLGQRLVWLAVLAFLFWRTRWRRPIASARVPG